MDSLARLPSSTHPAYKSPLLSTSHILRRNLCYRRPISARAVSNDQLFRGLSGNSEVVVMAVDSTRLVSEASDRQKTSPTATAALGRVLAGTLLLGCRGKDGGQTQVSFQGNGPVGLIQAITNDKGLIRGLAGNPDANLPIRADGKLDVGGLVGQGVVTVVRSHPELPQPYTGIVPINSGEIAEDLAFYLANSEQTNSALALGVSVHRDGSVESAGGFLIEVLPNASEESVTALEESLRSIPTMTQMLIQGYSASDVAEKVLGSLGISDESNVLVPEYGPCGPEVIKRKMLGALAALGEDEVQRIIREEGALNVRCEYCQESYDFTEDEVMGEMTRC